MKAIAPFVLTLLASVAVAQTPPAPGAPGPNMPTRVAGTLTAISPEGLKIRDESGQEVSLGVSPTASVVAAQPVTPESIKVGDFVASANLSETDGVGRSIEMRVMQPLTPGDGVNRPMTQPGAAPGQMMTNATVTKVAHTKAGLELDVQFPGGVRHLIVPPEVTIMGSFPVEPASLKPGTPVVAFATRDADGGLRATRVQIMPAQPARNQP